MKAAWNNMCSSRPSQQKQEEIKQQPQAVVSPHCVCWSVSLSVSSSLYTLWLQFCQSALQPQQPVLWAPSPDVAAGHVSSPGAVSHFSFLTVFNSGREVELCSQHPVSYTDNDYWFSYQSGPRWFNGRSEWNVQVPPACGAAQLEN